MSWTEVLAQMLMADAPAGTGGSLESVLFLGSIQSTRQLSKLKLFRDSFMQCRCHGCETLELVQVKSC